MVAIFDNFNRSDGGMGSNWSQIANDSIDIFSNQVRSDSGFPTMALHATPTDTPACRNGLIFNTTDDGSTRVMGEPVLFICGNGTHSHPYPNGYSVRVDLTGSFSIQRNGTAMGASVATGFDPNTGTHLLELEHDGSGIVKAYLDGAEVMSRTDGTPLTTLRHGFGWTSISFAGRYAYADDYAMDDLGGGPTVVEFEGWGVAL